MTLGFLVVFQFHFFRYFVVNENEKNEKLKSLMQVTKLNVFTFHVVASAPKNEHNSKRINSEMIYKKCLTLDINQSVWKRFIRMNSIERFSFSQMGLSNRKLHRN